MEVHRNIAVILRNYLKTFPDSILAACLSAEVFQYVHSLPEVSRTELTTDSFIRNFTSYMTQPNSMQKR